MKIMMPTIHRASINAVGVVSESPEKLLRVFSIDAIVNAKSPGARRRKGDTRRIRRQDHGGCSWRDVEQCNDAVL
jgi:hypothetical protein